MWKAPLPNCYSFAYKRVKTHRICTISVGIWRNFKSELWLIVNIRQLLKRNLIGTGEIFKDPEDPLRIYLGMWCILAITLKTTARNKNVRKQPLHEINWSSRYRSSGRATKIPTTWIEFLLPMCRWRVPEFLSPKENRAEYTNFSLA